MQNPFIIGDRLYLRPVEVEDGDAHVPWRSDAEIRQYMGMPSPTNRIRERESLEGCYKNDRNIHLGIALRKNDQLIGGIGLYYISMPHRHAELGILIGDRNCWSKGYGTEAMNLILEYGFNQLNLHRIYLFVLDFNPRAIRAYEKVGFKREAVFRDHGYRNGEYCDDHAMSILEDEWRTGT
ncbi:GNAT family N-acetyltransferase [Candidatus Poribacteria bacterium]